MTTTDEHQVKVANLIEACDVLAGLADTYLAQLEAEKPAAETMKTEGDPRYMRRVDKGIGQANQLNDLIDDLIELVGLIRHNHAQLEWAREGKMV